MEAKYTHKTEQFGASYDTVMNEETIMGIIDVWMSGHNPMAAYKAIAQAQAEISFEAGIIEVVEWAKNNSDITQNPDWQSKLREWEVE